MKKHILNILIVLAGLVAFTACDKNLPPVFDDANAFVAFDRNNADMDEALIDDDGSIIPQTGIIRLPVTLGSVAGLSETIKFTVNDGTAKAGVNFRLLTASGTLTFDATNRTQYIEIQPLYFDQYTGDLKFTVTLEASSAVKLGYMSTCTVTIGDVDHPLSALVGAYLASGVDYWDGPSTWTLTLYKDDSDDHMVWFDNIFNNAGWADVDTRYYGNVSEDLSTITVPLGQDSEYKYGGSTPVTLLGLDENLDGHDSGNMIITIVKDASGKIIGLDFGEEFGIWANIAGAGSIGIVLPGITAEKM